MIYKYVSTITLFYNFAVNFARKFRPSSVKSCTLQLNPSLNPYHESVISIYEDSLTSNSCKCIDERERQRGAVSIYNRHLESVSDCV